MIKYFRWTAVKWFRTIWKNHELSPFVPVNSFKENEGLRPRLLVVLGMHRSGTSALTRALQVLGVELGNNLLRPNHANENGYWEDADIQELNVEILNAIGIDWSCLAPISDQNIEILCALGFQDRAAATLSKKIHGASVFGIKDPRITMLLPFWQTVFDICECKVDYIFAIRNPISVAQSLSKRNDLDNVHSHLLWLKYVVAGLDGNRGSEPVFIDYDRLICSPVPEVGRLAHELKLEVDSEKLEIYRFKFLQFGLRHFDHDLNDILNDQDCPLIVHDIYTHLLAVASGEQKLDHQKIVVWAIKVEKLTPLFQYVDRLNHRINNIPEPFSIGKSLYSFARSIFLALPSSNAVRRLFRDQAL